MLKMQVPEGKPHAGMAHHKIHDVAWTVARRDAAADAGREARAPPGQHGRHAEPRRRRGAGGARVRRRSTPPSRAAAGAPPSAPGARPRPSRRGSCRASDRNGGGSYDDDDVSDERYWAAAELYVTTGDARYRSALDASPFRSRITRRTMGVASTISWQATDALGMMSLLLGAKVPADLKESRRRLILEAAEAYARDGAAAGFGQPLAGDDRTRGARTR